MNIFKIVFSNIRKRKGAAITFLIMVILSALMLSISLSLIIGGSSFFNNKMEESNTPHYSNYIVTNSYQDDFMTFAKNYDGVTDVSLLDALICTGSWNMKSGTSSGMIMLLDESELRTKSFRELTVIDRQAAETEDMIILPVTLRSNDCKSGETISLNVNGKIYEFTIYGFFEDVLMGASTSGDTAYLGTENFKKLKSDGYFTSCKNLSVRLNEGDECTTFKTAFNEVSSLGANEEIVITYNVAKTNAMMFVNIASLVLILFSLIILVIAFIVAGFSINNTIHEDIATIGALKSIGYKNKTLRGSQLLQYLIIAGFGSIIGSFVSLFSFGFIGDIVASTSGLLWINSINIIPVILSIIIICSLTSFITFVVSRKYKNITPINALRQGESHHSFRKNAMPLDKYKIPLNLHLGLKRCCKNSKNNITLFVVVSLLVFISSLVFTMSYNLNVDTTAMVQMVGLEMAEVWVQTADPELDMNEIDTIIHSHNEVNRTVLEGSSTCAIEDLNSNVNYVEDFSDLTVNTVVKGRYPELYNEIALGAIITNATGKGLGDTVTVRINGIEMSFIVVGITQDIGNGGDYCQITSEAMLRHNSEFTINKIYVYLNEGANAKDYIEKLNGIYGNQILTANPDEQIDGILNSMGGPFAAISIVMIVITIVIIGVVLFLLISALIRKDKKELGIMKAIGYKNRQLILQILSSMLPSLILGTILGIALGFIVTNPLLSAATSSMGLLSTYFLIPVLPTLLIGLGILGVSLLTTCLISLRLKKISPQRLIVEY